MCATRGASLNFSSMSVPPKPLLLVANGSYLYIGFDNTSGIHIYRTNTANPGSASSVWEEVGAAGLRPPGTTAGSARAWVSDGSASRLATRGGSAAYREACARSTRTKG